MSLTTTRLAIGGMSCGHCVRAVESALGALPGVRSATVRLEEGTATVEHEPGAVEPERIVEAVEEEGYTAEVAGAA